MKHNIILISNVIESEKNIRIYAYKLYYFTPLVFKESKK